MAPPAGVCYHVFLLVGLYHSALAQLSGPVRVKGVLDKPFLIHQEINNVSVFTGFVPDLLEALSENTGLQFVLKLADDGYYGAKDQNGTWSGMVGELLSDDADVALLLTQTSERYNAVDFTNAVMRVDPVILMAKPEHVFSWRERLSRLIAPVDFSVWLILVLAFLVTSTMLFIVASVNPFEWRAMGKRGEASTREVETFTCIHTFWFIISTLFWQGYVRAPRSTGGRIVTTGWFFFVMIFILSYTASLINFLQIGPEPTVARGYSDIKSFEDLANSENTVVGMLEYSSNYALFQNSPSDSVGGKIFKKANSFLDTNPIKSNYDGIRMITERPVQYKSFAYITESAIGRYIASRRCELHLISDMIAHRYLSMAVQKKSKKLLQTLNDGILKLQGSGKLGVIENDWFRKSTCPDSETTDKEMFRIPAFYPLEMQTISGAILALAVGIVAGCLVTAVEVFLYRKSQQMLGINVTSEKDPDSSNHSP